jgi:sulfite exporter TauE/SafE
MAGFLVEGFILGLSTGPYCLVACAPLFVPYLLAESQPRWSLNLRILGQFLAGRLLAYLALGAAAGALGVYVSRDVPQWVGPSVWLVSGIVMLVYAASRNPFHAGLCAWVGRHFPMSQVPLAFGALASVNVCPPFIAGLTKVVDMGSMSGGILYFLAFFVGTSVYVLPLMLLTPAVRAQRLRDIGWLVSFLVGVWLVFSGLLGLWG